jgi:geranylgeranyl diphosphate synthase, type II
MIEQLSSFAAEFDQRLDDYLAGAENVPAGLLEAVRYSAMAPGKRIRPYLTVRCCELAGGTREEAWAPAAAVECIHAFSLVHDDLPAMDNDDFRRGRPTCHKQFGEAMAILTGDALVVRAFELIVEEVQDAERAVRVVHELAKGSGWSGMIGGQVADIEGESLPPSVDLTRSIHDRKTAALFRAACRIGAVVGTEPAGYDNWSRGRRGADAGEHLIDSLSRFGQCFGLAFQIADDLLDVSATAEMAGKRVGKDAHARKQTFPRSLGVEESRRIAASAADEALAAIDHLGSRAEDLRMLTRFAVSRNY